VLKNYKTAQKIMQNTEDNGRIAQIGPKNKNIILQREKFSSSVPSKTPMVEYLRQLARD